MGASHEATSRQYRLLSLGAMRSTRNVVVVGHGMVGHRFVEALRSRDADGAWRVTVLAEETDAAYDRVGLTGYTEHWDRARLACRATTTPATTSSNCGSEDRVTRIDRAAKYGHHRRRPSNRLRRPGAGHRVIRVRTSRAGPRPAVLPRLSHPRRSRRDPRRRANARRTRVTPRRRGDRRWAARPGSRQRAALVRVARPRRRDGAAADGAAARRGRRRPAGPDDRRARASPCTSASAPMPLRRHNAIGPSGDPPTTTRCG